MLVNILQRGQGLGNQLWSIFSLQRFSRDLETDFAILGLNHLKCKQFKNLKLATVATFTKKETELMNVVREKQVLHPETLEDITPYNPSFVHDLSPNAMVGGYFQSEMYLPPKHEIYEQLYTAGDTFRGCTISIRGGEYKGLSKVFLGQKYFIEAIEKVRKIYGRGFPLRIVTDDLKLASTWFPDIPAFSSGGVLRLPGLPYLHPDSRRVLSDFQMIQKSEVKIIPNSSFAWWAAYSGDPNHFVIAPKYWAAHNLSDGYWSQGDILTSGWNWLDRGGELHTFSDCQKELGEFRGKNAWAS